MVVDAEQRRAQLIANSDTDGVLLSFARIPRDLGFRATLRRWSIDELPQLFNVFLGQMWFRWAAPGCSGSKWRNMPIMSTAGLWSSRA